VREWNAVAGLLAIPDTVVQAEVTSHYEDATAFFYF
jgi:hypothetical protein